MTMTVADARGWNKDADWVVMVHEETGGRAVVTRESVIERGGHAERGWAIDEDWPVDEPVDAPGLAPPVDAALVDTTPPDPGVDATPATDETSRSW